MRELPPSVGSLSRDHSVAGESQSLHPIGHPIRCSTKRGFKIRPEEDGGGVSACWPDGEFVEALSAVESCASSCGVVLEGVPELSEESAHAIASPASTFPCPAPWLGAGRVVRFSLLLLRGVGQCFARVSSDSLTGPTRPAAPP